MQVGTIGLDLGKTVFQVHGVDSGEKVAVKQQLRRSQVLGFFAKLPPCLVGAARSNCEGEDGVMRTGRAWVGRTRHRLCAHVHDVLIGTPPRQAHQGQRSSAPHQQAEYMTCTRPRAKRRIPLAPRAPYIHEPACPQACPEGRRTGRTGECRGSAGLPLGCPFGGRLDLNPAPGIASPRDRALPGPASIRRYRRRRTTVRTPRPAR